MEKLSSQGYFCVATDMRGYSENTCPKGVKNYTIKKLYDDILNIADTLNLGQFHLIAHDWGAGIGWNVVCNYPDRIKSWTALSIPHTKAFAKAIKHDNEQKRMSRYIGWFLIPILPEMMLRKNNFKTLRKLWKNSTADELKNYLSVFGRRKSLTGAINYYRANFRGKKRLFIGNINTPTLFIWGKKDFAIGAKAAEFNHKYMKGAYTYLPLEGGHWLIQTNYLEVETAIIEHLAEYKN